MNLLLLLYKRQVNFTVKELMKLPILSSEMKNIFLVITFMVSFVFLGQAQKDMYLAGLNYFDAKNYYKALEMFYADKYANANKDLLIRRVIANYHVGHLEDAKKDVSTLLNFEVMPDELFLYIGKIFHADGNYKKAIENYKIYLRRLSPKSDKREEIIHTIKQCGNAIRLKYQDPLAFVDNYGSDINTKHDEFRMIQSPNFDNKYYFSSARENSTGGMRNAEGIKDESYGSYNSDMYNIEMIQGKWMSPEKLNPFINSSRDELALDFSSDGSILFYLKGPDYSQGTIYTDTFSIDKKDILNPPRFDAPIYAEKGDVYLNLFNDSTILFSSNRPGGYGGQDLYVTYRSGKIWSKPKNLGPSVNSKYDEVSPYISKDGKTLFFSSNRLESLGGYDVFYSEYNEIEDDWNMAKNMGAPINSAGDDLSFYVSKDRYTASMSSDRKQGYGGFDLYVVYFKNHLSGQLSVSKELAFISNDEFVPDEKYKSIASNKSIDRTSKASHPETASSKSKKKNTARKTKKSVSENPTAKKEDKKQSDVVSLKKEEKEEYIINPLFYVANDEIITPANKRELDVIAGMMSIYTSLELEIKSHTIKEGLEAYDLYFSIKRAEKVAEYLNTQGISSERIFLKGYGSNYPVAKTETGGKKSKIAEKLNSRIEFKINNSENLPITVTVVEPYLVDYLRDSRGELFKTVEDGLSYRVQIASVKQMYQNQVLLLYNDSMIEKDQDQENYKYTLGLYEAYKDAKLLVKDLANYNITGAFIVPYINGQRIPKNKWAEYGKYYPDLLNFMQYNDE